VSRGGKKDSGKRADRALKMIWTSTKNTTEPRKMMFVRINHGRRKGGKLTGETGGGTCGPWALLDSGAGAAARLPKGKADRGMRRGGSIIGAIGGENL